MNKDPAILASKVKLLVSLLVEVSIISGKTPRQIAEALIQGVDETVAKMGPLQQ